MQDYLGIPADKMRVAPLGIAIPPDLAPAPLPDPFTIGYFARVAPEKGLHMLAEAYVMMRRELGLPPSRLLAAGYLRRRQQGYFDGVERHAEVGGDSAASSSTQAPPTGTASSPSSSASTSSGAQPVSRAERTVPAGSDGRRRAGRRAGTRRVPGDHRRH